MIWYMISLPAGWLLLQSPNAEAECIWAQCAAPLQAKSRKTSVDLVNLKSAFHLIWHKLSASNVEYLTFMWALRFTRKWKAVSFSPLHQSMWGSVGVCQLGVSLHNTFFAVYSLCCVYSLGMNGRWFSACTRSKCLASKVQLDHQQFCRIGFVFVWDWEWNHCMQCTRHCCWTADFFSGITAGCTNITPIGAGMGGMGPKKWKFKEIFTKICDTNT